METQDDFDNSWERRGCFDQKISFAVQTEKLKIAIAALEKIAEKRIGCFERWYEVIAREALEKIK